MVFRLGRGIAARHYAKAGGSLSGRWLRALGRTPSWTSSSIRASSCSPSTASPCPSGEVAATVEEAVAAAERIGYPCAIKAQVLIGGRGKAGGIKIAAEPRRGRASTPRRSSAWTSSGRTARGPFRVHQVWIEGGSDIAAEYYASIILDRSEKKLLAMVSAKGGMDVEEIAAEDPDALVKRHIDPTREFDAAAARLDRRRRRARRGRPRPGRRGAGQAGRGREPPRTRP